MYPERLQSLLKGNLGSEWGSFVVNDYGTDERKIGFDTTLFRREPLVGIQFPFLALEIIIIVSLIAMLVIFIES